MIRKSLLALALAVLAGAANASTPVSDFDPTLCATLPDANPKAQRAAAKPAGSTTTIARAAKSSPRKASGNGKGVSAATVRPRPKLHLANPRPPASSTLAVAPVRAPAYACPELGRAKPFNADPDGALATLLAGRSEDPAPMPGNGNWGNSDGNSSAIIHQNTEPRQPTLDPIASLFHGGRMTLPRNTFDPPVGLLSDEADAPGTGPPQVPRIDVGVPEIDRRPLLHPTITGHLPEGTSDPLAPLAATRNDVPEPASFALLLLGCAGIACSRRRLKG